MRSYDEVKQEVEALPWQKREAIFEAVGAGRPIEDSSLAPLAAEWAVVTRTRLRKTFLYVMGPLLLAVLIGETVLFARNDSSLGVGGALFVIGSTLLMVGLVFWATAWRPLVRAQQWNAAVTGRGEAPPKRERSNWVLAWLISWPITGVVGFIANRMLPGSIAGGAAFVGWIAITFGVKRALDDRS